MSSVQKTSSELDLLLLGRKGNGKSATGNTILRRNAFKCVPNSISMTTEYSVVYGRLIKVVDGPGFGDSDMIDWVVATEMVTMLKKAISANHNGYHAFLFVVRYGGRFTEKDTNTIKLLKRVFGDDFVAKYCILVVTCGDNYDPEETGCFSFDDWCLKESGVFGELVEECKRRVVLFDNRTKDEAKLNEQHTRLVSMVDGLSVFGMRYSWTMSQLKNRQQSLPFPERRIVVISQELLRKIEQLDLLTTGVQDMKSEIRELKDKLYLLDDVPASPMYEEIATMRFYDVLGKFHSLKTILQKQMTNVENAIDFYRHNLGEDQDMTTL